MATTTDTTRVTLTMPTELVDALDRAAERVGRARDEVVEEMIRDGLGRETTAPAAQSVESNEGDPTRPKVFGIVDGSPVSSEDFEDWLYPARRADDGWNRP